MKKINLIEWLSRNSHEKQTPQRFARYAAMLIMLLTLGVGQMWAATQKYIYCGISDNFDTYKGSDWGFNFWGGTSEGVKTPTYIANWTHDGRTYHVYRVQVYDDNNKAQFKGNDKWWVPGDGYSVTLSGTTKNFVGFSSSSDGWDGQFQENYQVTSTASLSATSTSIAIGGASTLTPSLSSNSTYNDIKSTSYSVTTNPGSAGSVTSGGVFSATAAGSYTVTATVTYNAKGFTGITKTATATKTITVYATVTFDREGGSGGTGSQNATYNSATSNISAPSKSYHDFAGYWTEDDGTGTMVINASGVWQKNISNFTDNSSTAKWIILTNQTLHAKWTPKNYDISYLDKGGSSYSGSNSASLPSSYTYGTGVALTDGVKSGYRFDGWFTTSACTGDPVTSVSSSDNGAKVFYAKWTENPGGTVTLTAGTGGQVSKDGSSWGASKSYTGIKTTDALNIYAQASAGYTFSSWTKTSGSGEITTNAATGVFTPVADADAALTASFNETMSTLATANSYDGASAGFSNPTKSVSSIGISTSATVTAASNSLGYTLTSWTITGGTRTDGGATNANPITVCSNGDGAAVTVTANYTGSNRPVSIYLPNSGNSWSTSDEDWQFYKLPGESGNTVTLAVDINKYSYSASGYKLGINIYQAGWDTKWWHNSSSANTNMDAHNCSNWGFNTSSGDYHTKLDLNVSGTYTFTLTNSTNSATQALSVTYPDKSFVEGAFPTAWSEDAYELVEDGNIQSVTINITSTGDKEFRLVSHGKLFGTTTKITKASNSQTLSAKNMADDGAVMTLAAYVTGNYTFSYNKSTKVLTVTYPVYNQVRISAASPTDASNTGNYDLSSPVSNVRSVTRSLKANTTYTFKVVYDSEWYGYTSGTFTRSTSTSSNSRTLTTSGGNLTLTTDYAGDYTFRFNQSTKELSIDFPTAYKVTYGKGTVDGSSGSCSAKDIDNGNASVTSNSTWVKKDHRVVMTAPDEDSGYTFDGWFDNNSSTGDAITTVKNCTITVTSAETYYACYHENKTAITITTDGHGTITTPNPNESPYSLGVATMQDINASANTGYHWNTWTVSGTAALNSSAATQSNKAKGDGTVGGTGTVTATFSPNTYSVTFDANGGTGDAMSAQVFTYDEAQALSANTYTRTGYDFDGWATTAEGAKVYDPAQSVNNLTATNGGTFPLFAHWTAKSYTVTLNQQSGTTGHSADGTVANPSVAYNTILPTISGTAPTADNGYAFMGFYTATGGGGEKIINANLTWVASVEGYTNASSQWIHDGDVTLYAYYKKAEITSLTFASGTVEPEATVTATAVTEPEPEGTVVVCWELLYNNGSSYSPQPTFTPGATGVVTFPAPAASGTYKVRAKLRLDDCGGDVLSTETASFIVAGTHNVTVQYKCGDVTVKANTTLEGVRPLDWSDEITVGTAEQDPFGYTFEKWVAGDGVTITADDGETTPSETTSRTIKIKANYDGVLTAKYTKDAMIYFKNTLNWPAVYVNFMTQSYWNAYNGSGNSNNYHSRNNQMSLVPGTTDIYYFEYTGTSTAYVSFTSKSQDGAANFWESDASGNVAVCYPTKYDDGGSENSYYGLNWGTPMFVPQSTQTPIKKNSTNSGGAYYYNKGYWRYYDPTNGEAKTGYTLKIYDKTEDDGRNLVYSVPFTNSAASGQLFTATVNLEAATGYGVKIERDNSMLYTNIEGHLQHTGDVVVTEKGDDNYKAIWLKATAAGEYEFIITCNGNGKICLQATFPAKSGDYRVLYTDNATWSNGAHTAQTWVHPSRMISAEANAEDIISFFVAKDNSPQYKIEKVTGINGETGAISWTQVQAWTDISVAKTGVYNFKITQNATGDGISSVTNIGEYTGDYYIRTDNAGSTKWDNYCTEDHKMTYSEYSKQMKDFTHYYMKYVDKDRESGKYKNVKFTIANDYSPCISDTLVQQTGDTSVEPAHVNASGDLAANANTRFMWDMRNNKLQRAYLSPAKTDGSKFLVLQGQSGELFAPDGTALTGDSEDNPGNNHGGGANAIQFTDKEHWMYEANVKAVPGGRVKLYANFHGGDFYFYGAAGESFDGANAIDLVSGTGDAQAIRAIYDFKTDRLIAAWQPTDEKISTTKTVNADIMLVREHQEAGQQINLVGSGNITTDKTVYGVMRFNRFTLWNRSTTGEHAVLPVGDQTSMYERFTYYISFPFDVNLSDIFGFGTMGSDWRISKYDGEGRAREGFFAERETNWMPLTNSTDKLNAYEGYLLQLNYIAMGYDKTSDGQTWANNKEEVELYFPAANTITKISLGNVVIPALGESYRCTIDLSAAHGGNQEANRTVKDSYWRCVGTPGFTNYAVDQESSAWTNFDWTAVTENLPYLYEWQRADNRMLAVSSASFTFQPMHAYLIQNGNSFTWTSVARPVLSAAVSRERQDGEMTEYEFKLEMRQSDQMVDRAFVRLTDKENVTNAFDFGQDLSKEMNSMHNLYTMIGAERLAANSMPISEQTTVIPVGVVAGTDGEYTFAIPEGTNGVGVTLIDNETGIRTSLSALDYTVSLTAGTYNERFVLEISPIHHMPTGIEEVTGDGLQVTGARKLMIDGILYIVKDGKMFDARGALVK